jgi:hypothetical protein
MHARTHVCADERTNGRTKRTYVRTHERTTDERTNGRTDGRTDERKDVTCMVGVFEIILLARTDEWNLKAHCPDERTNGILKQIVWTNGRTES